MVLTLLNQQSGGVDYLWVGIYSAAYKGGAISRFVTSFLDDLEEPVSLWIGQGDGIDNIATLENALVSLEHGEGRKIVAVLCTRLPPETDLSRVVLLPLDDSFFSQGVLPVLSLHHVPWEGRESKVFWCGRCCAERERIVSRMAVSPHSSVGFTEAPPGSDLGRSWALPSEFQGYKYVAIVDGNVIASSLMWTFAVGAVPVLITHPLNDFWFKKYLKPYENYVPVSFDMSDYDEVVEWMLAHDSECQKIAAGAMQLAATVFTPRFQEDHVRAELQRVLTSAVRR